MTLFGVLSFSDQGIVGPLNNGTQPLCIQRCFFIERFFSLRRLTSNLLPVKYPALERGELC